MNMDILLGQTLEVSEQAGLESFDPRFTDIATLVQKGDYTGAAKRSEALLEQEIYDIRIIGYFAYGVFLEQGFSGLASIFEALTWTMANNWEAIGPVRRRETHVLNSLKWLFSQLIKKLNYEENKKAATWNAWIEETDTELVQTAIDALVALQKQVALSLGNQAGGILDELTKGRSWLQSFQRIVPKPPEPTATVEEEPEEAPEEEFEADGADPGPTTIAPSPRVSGSVRPMDVSPNLEALLQKLDTFEALIQQGKFLLAALVADDINGILANFDPRTYFPAMFAKFSLLFARHIQVLRTYEVYRETPEWRVLNDLYRVDLQNFINFDADFLTSVTPPAAGGGVEDQDRENVNTGGNAGDGMFEDEYGND